MPLFSFSISSPSSSHWVPSFPFSCFPLFLIWKELTGSRGFSHYLPVFLRFSVFVLPQEYPWLFMRQLILTFHPWWKIISWPFYLLHLLPIFLCFYNLSWIFFLFFKNFCDIFWVFYFLFSIFASGCTLSSTVVVPYLFFLSFFNSEYIVLQ